MRGQRQQLFGNFTCVALAHVINANRGLEAGWRRFRQGCQPRSLVNKLLPLIFWHKKLTVLMLTGQGLVSVLRVLLERLAKTPGYAALSRACGISRYKDVDDGRASGE